MTGARRDGPAIGACRTPPGVESVKGKQSGGAKPDSGKN